MKQVGIDVGGTFTDLIYSDTATQRSLIHKVPTTSDDPSRAVIRGILELCEQAQVRPEELDHIFHGTTIATNAVLEYDGARTGAITTRNYRDIIHIARHQRPQNYSIYQEIPWQDRQLVRRRHRKVVTERLVPPRGDVLIPLDEAEVRQAVCELKAAGVESIAVCFLFSYLNPSHEERVRAIIEEMYPEAFVSTSADVSPVFREFERFTTCCLNAFIGPKVKRYVDRLASALTSVGIRAELRIMRSNGGVATAEAVSRHPVTTLMSGPAAGVLGGKWAGELSDRRHLITFDMGGTSADIGIVGPRGLAEAAFRDTWVAGYPVMVPMIDIESIGAGGGSIAYVDSGGAFRVGPRSAGANPGPACYGLGGEHPTVTDANVVVGRLDPAHFLGGEMRIQPALAEEAVQRLANRLGLSLIEAAEGIITIINNNMANAIRSRTIQKGHDPRGFTLVAFGGAGPLHAAEVADILGVPEVLVPHHPGITSAAGLLTTDLKYDLVRTEFMVDAAVDLPKLNSDLAAMEASVRERLRADGIAEVDISVERSANCRYVGQGYELKVPFPAGAIGPEELRQVWSAFHDLHRSEYGHGFPENPIELVNIRVTGIGRVPGLGRPEPPGSGSVDSARVREGKAWFRVDGALDRYDTQYLLRARLPAGARVPGPAVLLQMDSTTVVPPRWAATVDAVGNVILTRK